MPRSGRRGHLGGDGGELLPPQFASALVKALSALPDGGSALLERMIAEGTAIALKLPSGFGTLHLSCDPVSGVLNVTDRADAGGRTWRWLKLRRLILRDLLLRDLARRRATIRENYPLLSKVLGYPRPDVSARHALPALAQLQSRGIARLEASEAMIFERRMLPPTGSGEPHEAREDLQRILAALSPEQVIAMAQDDVFEDVAIRPLPTIFPMDEFEGLAVLVRDANPPSRASVSLVVPVEVALSCDFDDGPAVESPPVRVAILYLDLTPAEVMEVIRSNTLTLPAAEVLERSGLSLASLVQREAQPEAVAARDDFPDI